MYGGILHSGSLEMTFFNLFVIYIYFFGTETSVVQTNSTDFWRHEQGKVLM